MRAMKQITSHQGQFKPLMGAPAQAQIHHRLGVDVAIHPVVALDFGHVTQRGIQLPSSCQVPRGC